MGDNRDAGRAPGAAPAAEKKQPAPEAAGGGAVPEGAAADPGSALTVLAASYGSTLIGVLQGAAGNAEVDAELSSLQEGLQVAAQAKQDKEAFGSMSDGEKLEKYGGKGEGGGGGGGGGGEAKAPAEGQPPPGVADPGAAAGFHATRQGEVMNLAAQHGAVVAALSAAMATPGLAPELVAFLGEGVSQSAQQQAALSGLAAAYAQAAGVLAGSEFAGAAMPSQSVPALYEQRIAAIQGVVSTLDAMVGEYDAALVAEQAKIAECDTAIVDLQTQLSEAAAAKGGGDGGAGGGAGGAESKAGGAGGAGAGSAPAPAGAEAKSAGPGGGGGAGAGGGGDQTAAISAQINQQTAKKKGIEAQISANQGLINTMKSYRDQMNVLLGAYSAGSAPPSGGGG